MIPLVVDMEDLDGQRRDRWAFIRSPVRIGRGDLNDLVLAHGFVSTYHAQAYFDETGAWFTDLGSTNGSLVDGERLAKGVRVSVTDGTVVQIGTLRLSFSRRQTGEQHPATNPTAFARKLTPGVMPQATFDRITGAKLPPAVSPLPPVASKPEQKAPEDPLARIEAEGALAAVELDLGLQFASYRGTWMQLKSLMERVLEPLGPSSRQAALAILAEKFPEARREPGFAELGGAAEPGPGSGLGLQAPAPFSRSGGGGAEVPLLHQFMESYVPGGETLSGDAAVEAVLSRLAEVLEAFSSAFVEMQRGMEEFGKEMGIQVGRTDSTIARARGGKELLDLLLDLRAEGRPREIKRAYADFMVHQVALLKGTVEGVRALLGRLSPTAIEAATPRSVLPMRAASLWQSYQQRFHDMADDDSSLSEALFGREFARAYLGLLGRKEEPGNVSRPGRRKAPGGH